MRLLPTMPGRIGRNLVLCAAVALPLAAPRVAHAQMESREGIALQNQILELRRDLDALRAQRGGGDPVLRAPSRAPSGDAGDIVPQLLDRVQALEEQVRALRGRLDQVENGTQRQYQDLTKQIGDLAFRVGNTSGGGGPSAAPSPPPTLSPPPSTLGGVPDPSPGGPTPTGPTPRTPERAIQEGNAALGRQDFVAAEASAREVLQNNRTSPRAYDAQFLLAQALAGRRDFAQAAIAYDDAYSRAKTGAHAQDSLLGLAYALAAINEKRAACETLGKLGREFPNPRPDVRTSAQTVRARAGCG